MPCVGAFVAPRLGCWIVAEEPELEPPPPDDPLEGGGGEEATGAELTVEPALTAPVLPVLPTEPVLPVVPEFPVAVALVEVTVLVAGCGFGLCFFGFGLCGR